MAFERNKALIAKRFGQRAQVYESVTPVQKRMAEHLVTLVDRRVTAEPPKTILELGCGCGRLTRELIKRFPDAEVTAIDLAPEMIDVAANSIEGPTFIAADAETYWKTCNQQFDLIVSNATVQWFETPEQTLKAYQNLLADVGILAVATFSTGTFQELQDAFASAYDDLGQEPINHTHRLPGKPFWASTFPIAHFKEEHIHQEFPDVRSFLRSIQDAGATLSPQKTTTLTPSLYRAMVANYKARFGRENGHVRATYHALYILVGK